jgi:hypothetical protein
MSLLSHEAKVTYGSNIFFLRGKATRHKHLLWAAYFTNAFSYLNPMIALWGKFLNPILRMAHWEVCCFARVPEPSGAELECSLVYFTPTSPAQQGAVVHSCPCSGAEFGLMTFPEAWPRLWRHCAWSKAWPPMKDWGETRQRGISGTFPRPRKQGETNKVTNTLRTGPVGTARESSVSKKSQALLNFLPS